MIHALQGYIDPFSLVHGPRPADGPMGCLSLARCGSHNWSFHGLATDELISLSHSLPLSPKTFGKCEELLASPRRPFISGM